MPRQHFILLHFFEFLWLIQKHESCFTIIYTKKKREGEKSVVNATNQNKTGRHTMFDCMVVKVKQVSLAHELLFRAFLPC